MRTILLCGDKIVGTAVKTATGSVTYVTSPSKFDELATLAEAAAAHGAEMDAPCLLPAGSHENASGHSPYPAPRATPIAR